MVIFKNAEEMAEKHDLEKKANRLNQAMHDVIFVNFQAW